jgi:hypothetical protein
MEPKLPKIKPNIQPNNIIRASRGSYGGVKPKGVNPLVRNITGSDNLFTQLRERNPEVSNKRGTRTLFNMLGTFGTERNEKIIRMNLQLLRNTLVETFEIAKLLRMNAAGGSGGGYGGGGGAAMFLGAIAGGATIGAGIGFGEKLLNFFRGPQEDEGGNDSENDDSEDGETFVSEEEKIVKEEVKDVKDGYDDKKLESDLEKSSKELIKTIDKDFKGITEGIDKLVKGENIEVKDEKDSEGGEVKVEKEGGTEQSDQVESLIDGVKNSFKDVDILKSRIREGESDNDYGAMYSRDQEGFERGDEDITKMTINEVDKLQTDYLNYQTSIGREDGDRSAAMGAYQMLEPKKVAELMGLDPETTIFDKETQDKMSEYFLNYSGLKEFQAGEITAEEFNNRLAEQFASIKTTDGKGVYDDDGMNKATGNVMDILQPKESKYKNLDKGAFVPGEKKGEIIVIKQGADIKSIPGSGKKVTMVNSNTGKPKNSGPTLTFPSSSNPDDSNLSTKSILGVIG